MLPTKFRFIWPNGFTGEDLKKSANQKQELPMVAMFVDGLGQNEQSLERTFHRWFLPSFTSFGWAVSEEKIKMWKVNGRRTPSDGKRSHCLWQEELKINTKFLLTNACVINTINITIPHTSFSFGQGDIVESISSVRYVPWHVTATCISCCWGIVTFLITWSPTIIRGTFINIYKNNHFISKHCWGGT